MATVSEHPRPSLPRISEIDRLIARCSQKIAMWGAAAGLAGFAYYKTASSAVQFEVISALGPTFRLMDPETAHNMGILAAKWGLFPKVSTGFGRMHEPFEDVSLSHPRRLGRIPPSSRPGSGTGIFQIPSVSGARSELQDSR